MDLATLASALLIFVARVCDVGIGTLRTMSVVRGRRRMAFALGFVELLVWVFVVANAIEYLKHPVVAVAYALGFATGSVVGMILEQRLAFGQRILRIFSSKGEEIAAALRERDFKVTTFRGEGTSATDLLYVELPRRTEEKALAVLRRLDRHAFYMVEEVRAQATPFGTNVPRTGWLANIRRK